MALKEDKRQNMFITRNLTQKEREEGVNLLIKTPEDEGFISCSKHAEDILKND